MSKLISDSLKVIERKVSTLSFICPIYSCHKPLYFYVITLLQRLTRILFQHFLNCKFQSSILRKSITIMIHTDGNTHIVGISNYMYSSFETKSYFYIHALVIKHNIAINLILF